MRRSEIDAVVSHRLNPFTSGVARFNHLVADRLGVPVVPLFSRPLAELHAPLLSLKVSEMDAATRARLASEVDALPARARLFLHDWTASDLELAMVRRAQWVHCGNSEIHEIVCAQTARCDILWSPGSLLDRRSMVDVEISVLTFGMAHKLRTREFGRLRELLDATGRSYALFVSTANHESVSLEDGQAVHDEMRALFESEHLFFLGTLSDVAISNALARATFFAAFFPGGVRANNSSMMSALEHGAVVITNLDRHSPPWLVHGENVLDVNRCRELPLEALKLRRIGAAAGVAVAGRTWDALTEAMLAAREPAVPSGIVAGHERGG